MAMGLTVFDLFRIVIRWKMIADNPFPPITFGGREQDFLPLIPRSGIRLPLFWFSGYFVGFEAL